MSNKKYISVERANIAVNKEVMDRHGAPSELLPPLCVEMGDTNSPEGLETVLTCYELLFTVPPILRYEPHNFEPGDPNAHVWLETDGPVWFSTFYGGPLSSVLP